LDSDLVRGGDSPEVGHVLDGPDGEPAVDEAVVDEHVRHPEQRDPEPLSHDDTWSHVSTDIRIAISAQ
jgi:hypothetical protein